MLRLRDQRLGKIYLSAVMAQTEVYMAMVGTQNTQPQMPCTLYLTTNIPFKVQSSCSVGMQEIVLRLLRFVLGLTRF